MALKQNLPTIIEIRIKFCSIEAYMFKVIQCQNEKIHLIISV